MLGRPVTVEIYSMEAPRQVDLVLYIQVKLKDSIKEECEALWIRSAREIIKLQEQLDNLKTPQKGDFDKTNIDQL